MLKTQYNKESTLSCSLADESAMSGLGAQLAKQAQPGMIIYLDGDLGAGKTTLVRGFLTACGHLGAVKSPTFTIVEAYSLDSDKLYDYNQLQIELKQNDRIVPLSISKIDKYGVNSNSKGEIKTSKPVTYRQKVYHFDLYRLEDPEELEYLGIRDYLDGQAIALIEWPEKGEGVLPKADLLIKITHQKQGREVKLQPESEPGAAMVSRLALNL